MTDNKSPAKPEGERIMDDLAAIQLQHLQTLQAALVAENADYKMVLQFYANEETWKVPDVNHPEQEPESHWADMDHGIKATFILAKHKKETP